MRSDRFDDELRLEEELNAEVRFHPEAVPKYSRRAG